MPRRVLRLGANRSLGDLVVLTVVFVVTRALLMVLGVRYSASLNWMFLADPVALREHLGETVLYTHAYPPGMNVLTGLLLKLSHAHFALLAQSLFLVCGLCIMGSLYYLGAALLPSRRWAIVLSLLFSLIPASLYFENLYLYTYLVATFLSMATALLHRAVAGGRFWVWCSFFAICSMLGWLRATFHLVWFIALVGLAAWLGGRRSLRTVALASLGPLLLLLALYAKNGILFGSFGATSAVSTWWT